MKQKYLLHRIFFAEDVSWIIFSSNQKWIDMIFSAFGTIPFENTEPMTQKYFQSCFFFETIVLKV